MWEREGEKDRKKEREKESKLDFCCVNKAVNDEDYLSL